MHFNPDTCFVVRLTHARNVKQFNYTLGNTTLQETDSHSYLNWNKHIHQITASANRTLAFIRRNLHSCPINIKTTAYTTLVRPLLEYSSSVWDPHTQVLINQIEMVQRRAARFCLNDYTSREAGCVSEMLKQLDLQLITDASLYSTIPSMDTYPCLSINSTSPYDVSSIKAFKQ